MAATPITNRYTLGRGEIHLAAFKAGGAYIPDGFRYIGNSPAFGYTVQTQELDNFNMDHGVAELDFSVPTQVNRSGSFNTNNLDMSNMGLYFNGAKTTVTVAGATTLTETFIGAHQGYTYQVGITASRPVGVRKITNVVVKVAAAVKVLGTDYTVDTDRGLVYIIPGGSIAEAASMIVEYDQAATTYDQVISSNTPFEGALLYIADNPTSPTGPNIDYLLPWVRLTPNGELALKAENALQSLPFNIKILKAPGKAAVYANGQPYTA